MNALGVSVLCGSMPAKILRRAVGEGLPVLTGCDGAGDFAKTGDEIEVDFVTGEAINLTRGTKKQFPAMPQILLDLVEKGGTRGVLTDWLKSHPEQAAKPAEAAQ